MPTPSTSSAVSSVVQSLGLTYSSGINSLVAGEKWGGAVGNGVTLSVSFPWTTNNSAVFAGPRNNDAYSTIDEANATYHYGLSDIEQTAARAALQGWSNLANIKFSEVAETNTNVGDIRFAWTSASNSGGSTSQPWGWASFPNSYWPSGGDIWLSSTAASNSSSSKAADWSVNSYNAYSLLHEIGHALGLKHSFEDYPVLPFSQESRQYSIMSYTDHPHSLFVEVTQTANSASWRSFTIVPETPMLYDIAAIQYLYGANMAYKSGDDVYQFDPNTPFIKTIWDAGGNDTISVSNFQTGCLIDLQAGHFSSIHTYAKSAAGINWTTAPPVPTYDGTDNLAIAYNCIIENAIGGAGNDTLIGNSSNNLLTGGAGKDNLDGASGNDRALFSGKVSNYTVAKQNAISSVFNVVDKTGSDGTDSLNNIEYLQFADVSINLSIQKLAAASTPVQVTRLIELYVAFFNRVPDADGLAYWITSLNAGQSLDSIASSFYEAGVQYSELTGISATMTNSAFINLVYKNVLGRTDGGDAAGVNYWSTQLATAQATRASLVSVMLDSAHGFKGNASSGFAWVADLLDNKITVAKTVAIDWGISFNTPETSITQGMLIAKTVTASDTSDALKLIGINPAEFHLV